MKRIGVDVSPILEKKTGVGNYLFYLLKGLISLRPKDQFFLYTFRKLDCLKPFSSYENVVFRQNGFLATSEALWSQTTLPLLCRKDKLDCFWGPTQSIPLGMGKKTKTLITIHDFAYRLYPETVSRGRKWYLKAFGRTMYQKASRTMVNSCGTANRLQTIYKQKADAVVYPPLKASLRRWTKKEIAPVLEAQALDYNGYLVMLSTLEPRKNIVGTLEAYLSILHKREGRGILPLVIIGGKGWQDREITKKLKEACELYPRHIHLMGYLSDEEVCRYLSGARYFLMLSLYEGYGMPLAEARVCGAPVICFDVPEMLEAAENDAYVVTSTALDKQLEPFCLASQVNTETSEIQTAYRSNEELAQIVSEQIDAVI